VDYKSFLSHKTSRVLPYFGGTRVDTADRRLRIAAASGEGGAGSGSGSGGDAGPGRSFEPGWWRFEVDGRRAIPRDRAPPAELDALPAVRGHWTDGWVVASGRELGRIALPPEDEPPPLARVTARRWYSGELLLGSTDFEDDAEVSARSALEEGRSIAGLPGVVPSLRAAFALAIGMAVARERGVPVSLRELAPHAVAIGDGGRDAARAVLDRLVAERRAAEEAARERVRLAARQAHELAQLARFEREAHAQAVRDAGLREAAAHAYARRRTGGPVERADAALEGAGARMLSARRLAGDQLEVRLVVDDVRLISIVAAGTLQVLDAGLCLAGSDRMITLDSLPSVVREAVRTRSLNITRHDGEQGAPRRR
jgi:hypothetical protein